MIPRCQVLTCVLLVMCLQAAELPAQDLNQLKEQGKSLMKAGNYPQAIAAFQRALPLAERAYGPNEYSTIIVVNLLANAYEANGDYQQAVKLHERCVTTLEARNGPNDPELGTALNNLGVIYQNLAEYTKAENCFQRSLNIGRRQYGNNSPEIATELNNLANLYKEMGAYNQAEPLYTEAVRLYEASRSEKLPIGLGNLAGLYREMGAYDRAKPLFERSLKIRETTLGPAHADVGSSLNSLGQLYRAQGDLQQAEAYLLRALKIRETALGGTHVAVATTVNNLGSIYESQERFEEAESMYRRCLKIREERLGKEHPDLASVMNNLAGLLALTGRPQEAVTQYQQAIALLERQPKVNPGSVSLLVGNLASLQASQGDWDDAAASYDKSRRIVRSYVNTTLPGLSEREQLAFLRARDSRGFHAALSFGLARKDDPQAVARAAEWLINGKAVTHETLARRVLAPGGNAPARDAWVTLQTVRGALPPNGVLVEIVRLPIRNFEAIKAADRWQPAHFVAWIIPPAGPQDVIVLDLGPADEIDASVKAARQALTESIEVVLNEGERDAEKLAVAALQPLTDQVLRPILAAAPGAERLIISPDASLWTVPWTALPLDESTYAVEKYEISHVVCGRDLAAPAVETATGPSLIFADPDYDLIPAQARVLIQTLLRGIFPKVLQFAPSIKLPAVARLAGTAQEAAAVAPKIATFTGQDPIQHLQGQAQELMVKIAQRPQVLVISTHGFFLDEQIAEADDTVGIVTSPKTVDGQPLENPLLRCGLYMAGCNQGVPGEDGMLTGLEIVGMNLRGTRLVVLSACETGLGRIQNGEGVAGLRQAFELAGARAVVASLWQVEDNATVQLMSEFFGHLTSDKRISTALREAQVQVIASRREQAGGAHPFFWSAFNVTETGR